MASKNHLKRSLIPQASAKTTSSFKYINEESSFISEHLSDGDDKKVVMSIHLLDPSYECFESWNKGDMKKFWSFRDKLVSSSWNDVKATASKGANKRGFAMTVIPRHKYPNGALKDSLSKDVKFFELRVSGESRVHGFRYKRIFYICWLDKKHQICK